jgi:hypothetical protein
MKVQWQVTPTDVRAGVSFDNIDARIESKTAVKIDGRSAR